ncbi:MAG: glycosyltransferase [Anaerolineales bacterium]
MIGPVHPFRGGIAHYTSMLAKALEEEQTVRVVSFRRMYPEWLYPGVSSLDPSEAPVRTDSEYLLDPLNSLRWWQTARWIRSWNPDLVVFQWWVTFWAPAFMVVAWLLRRAGFRILFLIHNVLPHEERPWDRLLARLTMRMGDRFIVHTPRERERLLSLVPDAEISVHPHPRYDMFLNDRLSPTAARQKLGLPLERKILLFFGFVRPYKGLDIALEGLAILRDRGQSIHLLVAGEFWADKAIYTRLIEKLQLSTLVWIEDRYIPNEEVGRYFSAADIAIAPFTGGTQSGSATIALSFGLPLIVTEHIAEGMSASGANVIAIPAGDPASLADAVETLFKQPTPRSAALESAHEDWRQMAKLVSAVGEVDSTKALT